MAGFATVVAPLTKHCPGSKLSLVKPQPPWTPRELLLKSVLLPRMELQLSRPWSSELVNLLNMPSSGFVWRGPVPKIQVTPSASPSGWHDPQLLQASFDILPLKFRGMKARIGVPKMSLSGIPRAVKKASLPTKTACSKLPGLGGSAESMSSCRVRQRPSAMFMDVTEKLASLLAYASVPSWRIATPLGRLPVWTRQSTMSPAA